MFIENILVKHQLVYQTLSTEEIQNPSYRSILIGGEELHNNHHLDPANPKLSRRWFEFDIGWMWFTIFNMIGLAKLRSHNA